MRLPEVLIFLASWGVARAPPGKFWHISDLHLDPSYKVSEDPLQVCPSAGSQPVPNAGPWGDYLCDSPWILINSSIYAMKEIEPEPDFILWTGDDTPHVPNERLSEVAVLQIVEQLTQLIREAFPDTKVYAALGNHDFHPKNQLPAGSNNIYNQVAELWRPWLNNESITSFKEGAFYSEKLPGLSGAGRIVVLNTNLYYGNNEQTAGMADPGQQFQWLDDLLTSASQAGEMVYIIGHVPPGFFEKTRNKAWFREGFNEEYLKVVRRHHRVIAGQFFGHHHTDSFRMFYDSAGHGDLLLEPEPGERAGRAKLGARVPGDRGLRGAGRRCPLHARGARPHRQRPGCVAALLRLQLGQLRHAGLRRSVPRRARVRAARGGLRRVRGLPACPRRRARALPCAPARGAAGLARAARVLTLGEPTADALGKMEAASALRAGLLHPFPSQRQQNELGLGSRSGNEAPRVPPAAHFFHVSCFIQNTLLVMRVINL
ncbi:acid sphingomyelinase-like phosphodiesterase 3b isoform X1 [Cervus canadensis]|uniref:acid sphingomyelinase-like phosphodiesterase 3b isoform X1 n=1 Tax=Cervus canadensis TaxID=1574408 RepID=UPI0018B9C901|nr:acid sphingomyelinase-like phosphodiesterase 3b isoform X1 [Cervus canadensis]